MESIWMLTLDLLVWASDWVMRVWVEPVFNLGYSVVDILFFYTFETSSTKECNQYWCQNLFFLPWTEWFNENSKPIHGLCMTAGL